MSAQVVIHYEPIALSEKGAANGVAELDAFGTIPLAQIPASVTSGLTYLGTWNALTNGTASPTDPTLSNGGQYDIGAGLQNSASGDNFRVSVGFATRTLDGVTDWQVNDLAISTGSAWTKADNNEAVTSVAGRIGAVTLTTADLTDVPVAAASTLLQAASISVTQMGVNSVDTPQYVAGSVDVNALGSNSVTGVKIALDAVTTTKILNGAVTDAKLATDSVTTTKILNANVTAPKLAVDSVTVTAIAADAVTTAKILDANITAPKLAVDAVTTAAIAADAITTVKIANLAVTETKLAIDSVSTAKIVDDNVTAIKLAADSVTTIKILDANVTEPKLASASVTTVKIADATSTTTGVTPAKLAYRNVSSTITAQFGNAVTKITTGSGTLTVDNLANADRNFYKFVGSNPSLSTTTIYIAIPLPYNFLDWDNAVNTPNLTVKYATLTTNTAQNRVDITATDTAGSAISLTGMTGLLSGVADVPTTTAGSAWVGGTFVPGGVMMVAFALTARNTGNARAYSVTLNYRVQ